jgi:hypothetical protein
LQSTHWRRRRRTGWGRLRRAVACELFQLARDDLGNAFRDEPDNQIDDALFVEILFPPIVMPVIPVFPVTVMVIVTMVMMMVVPFVMMVRHMIMVVVIMMVVVLVPSVPALATSATFRIVVMVMRQLPFVRSTTVIPDCTLQRLQPLYDFAQNVTVHGRLLMHGLR